MALKLLVTVMLSSLGQRAFMNRTVGEIMWGYQDPFVNFVSKYFPNMFPEKGKFGLFAGVSVAQGEAANPGPLSRGRLAWLEGVTGFPGAVGVSGGEPGPAWLQRTREFPGFCS